VGDRTYLVREVFATVQGEGYWTGTPCVFVRFGGCNLWSGHDADRQRDAERNGARCPLWCDTDFVGGVKYTAEELVLMVDMRLREMGYQWEESPHGPHVVFSGGEPMLQLDQKLIDAFQDVWPDVRLQVETNGTVEPKFDPDAAWITVSPKRIPDALRLRQGDELKLVVPAYDIEKYLVYARGFNHVWLQPQADGESLVPENLALAVRLAKAHNFRVGLQTHKVLNVR